MKYQYFLLICLLGATYTIAQPSYLNTKTPYHPQQKIYTPAPKGYVPVFINYVGRHGARFQTSADKDLLVTNILQQAKDSNALTAEGLAVYKIILAYETVEKNNYGNLTMLGNEEQKNIAQRMQAENLHVFNNGKLLVEMTEKLRTQQSAKAFLSGLNYNNDSVQSIIFPATVDSILRFYDLSKAYKTYASGSSLKNHIDSLNSDKRTATTADDVCKKIFTNDFINRLNNSISVAIKDDAQTINAIMFVQSLYEVFASMFDASKELQPDFDVAVSIFNKIFSAEDLRWLDMLNSASDFYEKGPAENATGIQVSIASPLLNDLINATDTAIILKKYNAVLRFTHAEAISPLATLMEIPQASKTINSVFTFYDAWKAAEIIPMSANIQWILYSNGSSYLVKILLNEKEVSLPLHTKTFPYYYWNDVKSYYLNKLSSISKN